MKVVAQALRRLFEMVVERFFPKGFRAKIVTNSGL
jgi:hypothetical protein